MIEIEIKVPEELKQKLEEKMKGTGFKSIQEYLVFILEQVTAEAKEIAEQSYTEEEEKELRKSLVELGYM